MMGTKAIVYPLALKVCYDPAINLMHNEAVAKDARSLDLGEEPRHWLATQKLS